MNQPSETQPLDPERAARREEIITGQEDLLRLSVEEQRERGIGDRKPVDAIAKAKQTAAARAKEALLALEIRRQQRLDDARERLDTIQPPAPSSEDQQAA
jgi:hypothetical protein